MKPIPVFAWILTIAVQFAGAEDLTVVSDGESNYVIAYAEKVEQVRVTKAAEALQWYLREATGASLPIMAEADVPDDTPALYLGRSAAARRAGISVDEISGWSYHNRVVGRDIFLIGEDRETVIAPGTRPRTTGVYGSFKAVTAFLEYQVGVRFLMPGRFGTHIDKKQQRWTAEMHLPFATLEVAKPDAGDTWTMNIGRNQFPKGAENSRDAVVYLWSPNIQSRTFHDMSVFGELVFR